MLPVLRRNSWSTAIDDPFSRLRGEVDTLFDRFFPTDGASQATAWSGVPVAMWEDEDHLWIEAELPGFAEKDVEVTVHNGMLFIRCERQYEDGRKYLFNTRSYGRFERVIALPSSVEPDQVEAKLQNGVLTIQLSKTSQAKPKKITVKAS